LTHCGPVTILNVDESTVSQRPESGDRDFMMAEHLSGKGAPVLEIRGLEKSFAAHLSMGRTKVVKGIDLDVRRGEIYGLLGPNGAGKTTTLKIVLGLLRADRGTVRLFGKPPGDPASRLKVGFLPENPYFYDYLTAREFMDFYARLVGIPAGERRGAIEALLDRVGLRTGRDRPLRKFSKGMIQRVGFAQALLGDPEFVVLDEPMSGLDPIGRREFRDIILSLRESGKTVFFSSHILQDAEMICDRVGIVKDGKLVREGDLATLLESPVDAFEVTIEGEGVPGGDGWTAIQSKGGQTLLRVEGRESLDRLLHAVYAANRGRLLAVIPLRQSLEDLFLSEVRGTDAAGSRPLAGAAGRR
jgi:ABC-2 type transport system ATP-binding protein